MEGSDITIAEAIIDNGSLGKRTVRLEASRLAKQAAGSVLAHLDDKTITLSAATVGKSSKDRFDFFPPTAGVEEHAHAAGHIPGSFFRHEGRAGTEATLVARLIDCPLCSDFAKGLRNEAQVTETVLTVHPDDAYDVFAINTASISIQIAGLPFTDPTDGTRFALTDGQQVTFPRWSELKRSVFNIVVTGRTVKAKDGSEGVMIMMVETGDGKNQWNLIQADAPAPTEDVVADDLEVAEPFIKVLCEAQIEVAEHASKETAEFPLLTDYTDEQRKAVEEFVGDKLAEAFLMESKLARDEAVDMVKAEMLEGLVGKYPEQEKDLKAAFRSLEEYTIRQRTLRKEIRTDGRILRQIRSLSTEVEVLPRVHDPALLQRGETQILDVTAPAMLRMEQQFDNLSPVTTKRCTRQYNFAPFSTGEVGHVSAPKRRETGRDDLAEHTLIPVIPPCDEFPYVIRQVSGTIGSNGSSPMGLVYASTLSLLQTGAPLRAPVVGTAVGLMTGEVDGIQKSVTLTDILDAEDGFGDMDLKVMGTKDFITAPRLGMKLDGIDSQALHSALVQVRDIRLTILDLINRAIDGPDEMGPNAPCIITVWVPVDKISEVIDPKGKMVNQIQEDTGTGVTIEDGNAVYIASASDQSAEAARQMINQIADPRMPEVDEYFAGMVIKTISFSTFVSLTLDKDGLLHILRVCRPVGGKYIESVEDVLQVDQQVEVEIAEIDDRGKLSLHAALDEGAAAAEATGSESMERTERRERRDRSEHHERRPRTRTRRKHRGEGESVSEE